MAYREIRQGLNIQRKKYRLGRAVLLLPILLMPASIAAQSMSEFEQWKKQYLGEFKQYKDQMDKEFASFLQQRWKAFDTEPGEIRDEAPKPVEIPVAKPQEVQPQPVEPVATPGQPKIPVKPPVKPAQPREPIVRPKIPPVKMPVQPVIPPARPTQPDEKLVTIEFLGYQLPVVDGISGSVSASPMVVNQQGIQKRFSELAQSEYPDTVRRLQQIRQRLKLNDWAYMRLVQQFSAAIESDPSKQNILSWFLLLKSGLDARVAYDKRQVFLLVPTRQELFDIAFFTFDGKKYYDVSRQKNLPQNLYSYDGKYPKRLSSASVALRDTLNSKQAQKLKTLNFRFNNKDYRIQVPYNHNTVRFLGEYPQMDLQQYFRTPVEGATAKALLQQLAPLIEGKTQTEAVNLLLRFVQKSFRYATDQKQFGAENYLFVEETIFYPASDCEDRSILFAWLVRELLGLDVVALDFPGHVATAVALTQPVGDVVQYKSKTYTVADPTYINANVGMKMPQYKNTRPEVISIL